MWALISTSASLRLHVLRTVLVQASQQLLGLRGLYRVCTVTGCKLAGGSSSGVLCSGGLTCDTTPTGCCLA